MKFDVHFCTPSLTIEGIDAKDREEAQRIALRSHNGGEFLDLFYDEPIAIIVEEVYEDEVVEEE